MAISFGCKPRVLVLPTPERVHPIDAAAAEAVQLGMTVEQVVQIAGDAGVVGAGVAPIAGHPQDAGVYHVFWDFTQNHDPTNGTWLYLIRDSRSPRDAANDLFLFVEMKGGLVSKVYQGTVGSWGS
jgi:hypothetical protein